MVINYSPVTGLHRQVSTGHLQWHRPQHLQTKTPPGTRLSPTPQSSLSTKLRQARTRGASGSTTVTFCSVHLHNLVAKKRDASTDLLRRLRAHMTQHNVGFVGGDFNMSAFSTVGDVFADPEFSAPGNSLLWEAWCLRRFESRVRWLSHHAQAPV